MRFFIGGYSSDLDVAWLDSGDGSIEIVDQVTTPENASFLRYAPELGVLYASVETGYRKSEPGKIAAYRCDDVGQLTAIGSASSCGTGACHVDVDPQRKLLAAANYGGESFALIRLTDDGKLGENAACVRHEGSSVNRNRQAEPHPHATQFGPGRRFLYVCDLGIDKVMVYPVDELLAGAGGSAGRVAAELTPGSGPRHLAFSAEGSRAYLVNELSNDVVVYAISAEDGALEELQKLSTLPNGFDGENTAAEIQLHPSGRFLYASNRGHDTIAVFTVDSAKGTLTPAGHFVTTGSGPRHFQVDPSGRWCLVSNQGSDHVVSFRINTETGMGTWTGRSINVPQPACSVFLG